ncbi:hypothetical protein [Desulfurobacterium atlanticum]|uniref:Uncharacterized protein n=1 Tax=Desulfurobacterium atlanticum TaxID=240169 RepID=A0A238ZVP0_9BACT|nr:hypothetical protein [Desulfurobacterium atlanticum]SNR87081.1 hypothetical protein SAMN06265340_11232 [Desulfurobacterium atlanticum]
MCNKGSLTREFVVEKFKEIEKVIGKKYPTVAVALCELLGRRWSFLTGVPDRIVYPFVGRVEIGDRYGVSVFDKSPDIKRYEEIAFLIEEFFSGT